MNAKEEFLKEVGKVESTIKCAEIEFGSKRLELKVGYTDDDYAKFIESLDFKYDNGYGTHGLSGTIWYEDGTWCERGEYDGSEWWRHVEMPKIPESLDPDTYNRRAEVALWWTGLSNAMRIALCYKYFGHTNIHAKIDVDLIYTKEVI